MNGILKNVENDEVELAYNKLMMESGTKDISGHAAYSVVITLNKLVSTALRNKTCCKSKSIDLYKLADFCCNVREMWTQNRTACMQCIYHVIRYFLTQSEPVLARKLCEHFLQLAKKDDHSEWEEKESLVLSNIVVYFAYYFYGVKKEIVRFPDSVEISAISWFTFLLAVNELNNFAATSELFKMCYSLLRNYQTSSNHGLYIESASSILNLFTAHLDKMAKQKSNWKPKEDSSLFYVNTLTDIISFLNSKEISDSIAEILLNFNRSMKDLLPIYAMQGISSVDFNIIEATLKMCSCKDERTSLSLFDGFLVIIGSKETFSSDVYSFIHSCLSVFHSKICKLLYKDDERVAKSISLLYGLFVKSKPKSSEISKTKCNELLHAFTVAMHILSSSKVEAEILKQVYKLIRLYFREFSILLSSAAQNRKTVFEYGVNYCINAVQAYENAELYRETANLSKDLMKYILPLGDECFPVDSFSLKLEKLLNVFIVSYEKINLSVEALIALTAFAGVHPQFTEVVFKYWAELKVISSDINLQKDFTCYDVITSQKEVLEEKWAPCLVESIDIDKFLLEEVRAYSKLKDLHVQPVLSVFRVAAKIIKDKLMQAQLLAAAVDSVSSGGFVPALNNLSLSLENIYKSLLKLKEQTVDQKKLCEINCVIGNVLYQQVRCDIVQIRKKAEDEVELMTIPGKEGVPILKGEECNVTPAYSCLKIDEQKALAEKMFACINCWAEAVKNVTLDEKSLFSFRYLKSLAYLLRLYCYKNKEIEMWRLIYNLSKRVENEKYKVLAVAELLGLSLTVDPAWIKDAEDTLKSEKEITKKSYIYSLFFVNYGKNLYLNKKSDEALRLAYESDEVLLKRHFLVFAQHKMLVYLLKKESLELSTDDPVATLYILIKVFENILFLVKNNKWKTFCEKCVLQWLLLDFSLTMSRIYFDLRLVRHARCYAKKQLTVAQRLALPVMVCGFLVVLCNTDLQTGFLVDASEKLSGLDTILKLDHISIEDEKDLDSSMHFERTVEADINRPQFLSHEPNCTCLICISMELQTITLNAFTLKGVYALVAGAHNLAKHVFSIGEEIIEALNEKAKDVFYSLVDSYYEAKVRFYLSQSLYSIVSGKIDEALTYNQMAQKALEPLEKWNRLLKTEISSQCITLLFSSYEPPPIKTCKPKLYTNDMLPVENVKTPKPFKPQEKMSRYMKSVVSSTKFKLPISPRPSYARRTIFDDIEKELEGKYELEDKENISSPEFKSSANVPADKSPLAKILPVSPKLGIRKNLFLEESNTAGQRTPQTLSEWALETPKAKEVTGRTVLTRTRKAQTEKKIKKSMQRDLFATPYTKAVVPEIKIFCDDGDDVGDLCASVSKVSRTTTRKKQANTIKKSTVKKNLKPTKVVSGRKLTFDSDTDDETKSKKAGSSKNEVAEKIDKPIAQQQLFNDHNGKPTQQNSKEGRNNSWQSDESAIIEPSFIEHQEETMLHLPLTPCGLEESMKKLSLSGKKILPLSTKKMVRLKNLEQTPSTPLTRTRSRICAKNSKI